MQCLEIEEKYRGVAGYEWQETKSKESKAQDRKLKKLDAERTRRREERQVEIQERRRL